jgi:hypothetical protein
MDWRTKVRFPAGAGRLFCLLHGVEIGSEANLTFYPTDTGIFSGIKPAGT